MQDRAASHLLAHSGHTTHFVSVSLAHLPAGALLVLASKGAIGWAFSITLTVSFELVFSLSPPHSSSFDLPTTNSIFPLPLTRTLPSTARSFELECAAVRRIDFIRSS